MRIKSKNGLKVAIIAVALLLCLALAIGITGAFYQAKRQATGTLSMDQGIIIDYKGFGKTPDEGIWTRENKTTFLLFSETNAQPGEHIAVNAAGIRANEKSVNFYARVKLSYKFYNVVKATEEGGKDTETEVTLAAPGSLITTSANFFGTNWVDGGGADGYYYYAAGSTLNKFEKGTQTFVELFAADAKFVIEGAGFTGANNNGEGGGFKIDETTSINKIEVYLTLETLQGDATAEQAKALGWEITTGGTEGEKVVELTPEDYTSTTTTDAATGEEKTIYTPNETFVGKNPKYAFTFSLNDTDKTATITGPVGNPTELDIPSKLVVNNKSYITENIGDFAFEQCESLTSIKLPNSLKNICKFSFAGTNLTDIIIPNGVKIIGESAFLECYELVDIIIPDSLNSIGFDPFEECNSLQPRIIKDGIKYLGNKVNKYIIAWDIIDTEQKSYIIQNGCKIINGFCFQNSDATEIVMPNGLLNIDAYAFYQCTNLNKIEIPKSVTNIGFTAFGFCSSLISITIPSSVTYIGKNPFSECNNLVSINVASENKYYHSDGNCLIETASKKLISGCKKSVIPNDFSVTIIAEDAFFRCQGLSSITIPYNIISVEANAFYDCRNLNSILIGSGVENIGEHAFASCTKLSEVNIPKNVTNIGNGAFSDCNNLNLITVDKDNVTYFADGSSLIEKETNKLLRGAKNGVIPDGIVVIAQFAFSGYEELISFEIPNTVKSIEKYAFARCSQLTNKIGEGWIYAEDYGMVIDGQWVTVKKGDVVKSNILLAQITCDIKRA